LGQAVFQKVIEALTAAGRGGFEAHVQINAEIKCL